MIISNKKGQRLLAFFVYLILNHLGGAAKISKASLSPS